MTYRDRRRARAERLRGWAEKNDAKAAAAGETARAMADAIPFGQPILVGHHSEGRDRRYRSRIGRTMSRSIETSDKAREQRRRADSIDAAADRAIYRDDPDARERLTAKLADLEGQRDRIKRYNATCRKDAADTSILDETQRADLLRIAGSAPYQLRAGGAFPAYALSNLSGRIKATRDRLADLEQG